MEKFDKLDDCLKLSLIAYNVTHFPSMTIKEFAETLFRDEKFMEHVLSTLESEGRLCREDKQGREMFNKLDLETRGALIDYHKKQYQEITFDEFLSKLYHDSQFAKDVFHNMRDNNLI